MGSCFQLSCHMDTDPRGPLPGSGGTAQVLRPGQVLVSPPAWCGTGRALPGQQCPAAPGQATSPGSSRRSPPAPAPGCPPQSAAPAIDSVILSQAAGKLSLDPRGQGRLKAMGEAQLGAQPTRDPMDLLSTARSALQNPHPQTGAHSQDLGVALHFLVLRLFQSCAWFKLGALSSNHGFIRSATNVAADSSRL